LGRPPADLGVDLVAVGHLDGNQLAGQLRAPAGPRILGQVAFQDGVGGALSEVCLEHGGERQAPARAPTSDPVSPRRHRSGP
jgi:hypothetical protein